MTAPTILRVQTLQVSNRMTLLWTAVILCVVTHGQASEPSTCDSEAWRCSGDHCGDTICLASHCDCDTYGPPTKSLDETIGAQPGQEEPAGSSAAGIDSLFDATNTENATSRLPSGLGAVAAAESPSTHMIGDFFGSGYFLGAGGAFTTVPIAGGDRRFKATDNISPLPQDRVFFNYHHFHNAVSDVAGETLNVDRFTFGVERTFLDEMMSLEVRVPFAGGLDSTQVLGITDSTTSEFGNVSLTVKMLWYQCGSWTYTSGLATVLPTADDASVSITGAGSVSFLTVLENNAVHMQPYLGVNYSNRCSRLFSTAYVAVDVDLNGNELFTDFGAAFGAPTSLISLGDVRDQTQLFFDWQIGYWLYQDYGHIGYLNGVAPVLELHYSQQLEDPEFIAGIYENPFGKATLLNLTAGLVFDFRRALKLTVYGAAPLRREEALIGGRLVSSAFDAEFGVQCAYRY